MELRLMMRMPTNSRLPFLVLHHSSCHYIVQPLHDAAAQASAQAHPRSAPFPLPSSSPMAQPRRSQSKAHTLQTCPFICTRPHTTQPATGHCIYSTASHYLPNQPSASLTPPTTPLHTDSLT